MLFNSYLFILGFLPIALILFSLLSKLKNPIPQIIWIAAWSCFFYAYWKPKYLFVLMGSVCVNYLIAQLLMQKKRKWLFILGIIFNVTMIVYFKYKGFLFENLNALTGSQLRIHHIALPLGISFITFQKIGYLVDVYMGKIKERNFLRFLVFISFFPQLIAGPIVHYNPLMSQFSQHKTKQLRYDNLTKGIALFVIGLAKKVLLADTLASYSDNAFSAAMASVPLSFIESWIGTLAYTLQIYFDFSGYSDMAIGTALMFNIRLPINFNSPYKSENIIDFWRRWHITLSTFLRDYIYIPLGGNRKGEIRKFVNLFATMLIGGLWHGANWTFVIWGGIHGSLLTINHLWRKITDKIGLSFIRNHFIYKFTAHGLTFLCVAIAWVYFRIPNLNAIKYIFNGMIGNNGFIVPQESYLFHMRNRFVDILVGNHIYTPDYVLMPIYIILFGLSIVWFLPNSQQLIRFKMTWTYSNILRVLTWKPHPIYLFGTFALFYSCLVFMTDLNFKPFAYFAF